MRAKRPFNPHYAITASRPVLGAAVTAIVPKLTNLRVYQVDQQIDVIGVGKTGAGIDVQTGEGKVVGQADLQNRQVPLQPLLLVNHQVRPAAANRFHRCR